MRKVESIGDNAFKACKGIGAVILPENNFDKLKDIIIKQTGKDYKLLQDSDNVVVRLTGKVVGLGNKILKNNYIAFGTVSDINGKNKKNNV